MTTTSTTTANTLSTSLSTKAGSNEYVLGPFAGLPKNPNQTRGAHWSKLYKEGQEWKTLVGYAGRSTRLRTPFSRAQIHIHVSLGDNRRHDWDNIVASLKQAMDGLSGIMIEDDDIDHIGIPTFSVDRAKPRQFSITVRGL